MRVIETRIEHGAGQTRLVGLVQADGGKPEELHFSVDSRFQHFLHRSADPFLCALLIPCMHAGESLQIDEPVSVRLANQVARLQDILFLWHPGFRRIAVKLTAGTSQTPRSNGVLALFSGGIDSFYTLLRSVKSPAADVPRATHLLFIKGLEQPHSVLRGEEQSIEQVASIANQTGTQLVVASTNLRDRFALHYELYYFGSALAATVHALSGGIGTLLMPSSHSYAHLDPLGSHPLLDPLWSSERLDVIHHGAEARRVDKTAALLAEWPESIRHLRVCLENNGGNYNCGRCRKCLRTMVTLQMLGALPKAGCLPDHLPADAPVLLRQEYESWLEELQQFGRERAETSPMLELVERVLAWKRRRRAIRLLCENTPLARGLLPAFDRWRQARWQKQGS